MAIKTASLLIRLNQPEPKTRTSCKTEILKCMAIYADKAEMQREHYQDKSYDVDLSPMLEEIIRLAECYIGHKGSR